MASKSQKRCLFGPNIYWSDGQRISAILSPPAAPCSRVINLGEVDSEALTVRDAEIRLMLWPRQ